MYRSLIIIMIVSFIVSTLILIVNRKTIETITYFPIDPSLKIEQAMTTLETAPLPEGEQVLLLWKIHSSTKYPLYLRQDVSLLFKNGYLFGVINQWQTNTKEINEQKNYPIDQNSLFQSISFHHGEHHENHAITSLQKMTYNELYVVCDTKCTKILSFKDPHNLLEENLAELFNEQVKKQLEREWQALISEFNIAKENYLLIPLTDLANYNSKPLPNLSKKKSQRVIGQLWEGLYKNYLLPLDKQKDFMKKSGIPLILLERQGKHIIILYYSNGKAKQLYQNIS